MAGPQTLAVAPPGAPAAVRPVRIADPGRAGPAVRTTGLRRSYRKVEAVRGVDLEVARGEIFGLVGPDGAGKTTLIQMLCGILDPSGGTATVLGFDTVRQAARLGERIGYMSQAFSLYADLSVAENLDFFADLRFVEPERRRERIARLLRFSRLERFVARRAGQLSGGMQKKLALATTLVHDPELLLLDEPTTGVDPVSRRDFWEIVFDFLREGVSVIVATPYLDEAERCHRVALMHEGRILAVDTPEGLKARLEGQMAEVWTLDQPAALARLRADPEVSDAQIFGRSIHARLHDVAAYRRVEARLRESGTEIEGARCIEPSLEDVFVSLIAAQQAASPVRDTAAARSAPATAAAAPGPTTDGPPAVEVRGLTRRFGSFVAVDDVSFAVRPGEVFGFLGPNGSGKSTTIRMLTGLLEPSGGSAWVAGLDVRRDARRIKPLLGYTSQRFSLYDDLTADENLEFFGGLYGVPRRERRSRRAWALASVGLGGAGGLRARDLPGGLKQRLALACAIQHRPRILFLDEPTSGVDPLSRREFWDLIFRLAATGVSVLVTTHYMDEAERCDRLAVIDGGRIVAAGTPAELRAGVAGHMVEVAVAQPVAALKEVRAAPGVLQSTLFGSRLHVLLADPDPAALRAHLERAGQTVQAITPVPLNMEDVFAALIEGTVPGRSP
jgi:ABC-2 type transport system ATP-binding protein